MGQWGRSFIHTGGLLLSAVHNNTRARELAGRKVRGGGKGSFFLCTFCQWHFDTGRRDTRGWRLGCARGSGAGGYLRYEMDVGLGLRMGKDKDMGYGIWIWIWE